MFKDIVTKFFAKANIEINGQRPWDIKVINENFYLRFLKDGRLGIGEMYVDQWWDCDDLDALMYKLYMAQDMMKMESKNLKLILSSISSKVFPYGSMNRSSNIAHAHYDLGNDLFKLMLDKRMVYTCAYWDLGAKSLEEAQEHKLELVCRKLMLEPGMKVLDIGCGFGSFAKYASEKYKVHVVGVTVSKEQAKLANELCKGLSVEIIIKDYREVSGKFDRVVSIGMFEAVGKKYFRVYFEKVKSLLKDDGIFLLHTIGSNHSHFNSPWLDKYIFPGCFSPSIKHIGEAYENLFYMEDWHNVGHNYYQTLIEWYLRFDKAWPELSSKYDDRFYRIWKFYLLSMAPAFKSHAGPVWQIVFTHRGLVNNYPMAIRKL